MAVANLADQRPVEVPGDALVVTTFSDGLGAVARDVDALLQGEIEAMRSSGEIRGRLGEVTTLPGPAGVAARRVLVLGLGDRSQLDAYRLHNAYTFAGRELRRRRLGRAILVAEPGLDGATATDPAGTVRAMVTGLLVAGYDAAVRKTDTDPTPQLDEVLVAGVADGDRAEVASAIADAAVMAEATMRVQAWVNLPSNLLTPTLWAESVREACTGTGLSVEVMDRDALQAVGAGALLGIAQGSEEPPAMIVVHHRGGDEGGPVLALVGKGITFDTGGISIKPSLGMEMMKFDLGGGAAVLSAMLAIDTLKVAANVVGIVPATENMPGGRALKPGDVVSAIDGTTIEVVNTDAEGRVVLADGLAMARRLGATHIVDVATLTGAAVIALGHVTAALMTSDRDLAELVLRAGEQAGDRFAELPMHPEYDACLHSEVADLCNWGGREAGTICGGVFIRAFSGGLPWVHLDIAGTVWNDQASLKDVPSGATGSPVRTLVWLARLFAQR